MCKYPTMDNFYTHYHPGIVIDFVLFVPIPLLDLPLINFEVILNQLRFPSLGR